MKVNCRKNLYIGISDVLLPMAKNIIRNSTFSQDYLLHAPTVPFLRAIPVGEFIVGATTARTN